MITLKRTNIDAHRIVSHRIILLVSPVFGAPVLLTVLAFFVVLFVVALFVVVLLPLAFLATTVNFALALLPSSDILHGEDLLMCVVFHPAR